MKSTFSATSQKIITFALLVLLLFILKTGWISEIKIQPEKNGTTSTSTVSSYVMPLATPPSIAPEHISSPSNAAASISDSVNSALNPQLHVRIAYVSSLTSDKDWYSLNPSERWPLASLTKLMTAVVALKHFSMTDAVTIPAGAFKLSADEVDEVSIQEGERYSLKDLLVMALLPSSNKAADALAAVVGRNTFISEMNAQAKMWGMNDTYYNEPTGLSVLNQSTAEDLKTLAKNIYQSYPQIFALTRQPQYPITELHSGRAFTIQSINQFAGQSDFLGGKTGYTDEADGNLLSLFLYKNDPTFFLVMGSQDRFQDTMTLMHWLKNTGQGG